MIAFVTRLAAERGADLAEMERDLAEQATPSADVRDWPLRMVID